jgi:ABC-type dipeptide/oligopeptide/nickel transport system permease component
LRNAAIPIVTTIALQFGHLIGGSVVTESVFAWPGLGRVVVQAIFQRDAPMVQGGIIIMAVIFTLLNLAVDLVYGKLDPTIRFT